MSKSTTGDLIVTVDVDVPTTLSQGERDAIETLAAAGSRSPREAILQAAHTKRGN
ncbi:MAG: hypothetical protein ACKOPB_03190 [Actinomycetota bacterium]